MAGFFYVYILQSVSDPDRYYVGCTSNLRDRLRRHNAGELAHTSKFTPWCIKTYIAFPTKLAPANSSSI